MKLIISGKHIDVGDALRTHVTERLSALVGKYYDRPIDATVTFSRQAHLFRTDCTVHFGAGLLVNSHGEGTEIYASFDGAAERVEKRLRRYKRRLKDHHNGAAKRTVEPAFDYILAPQADDEAEEPHVDGANGTPLVIAESDAQIETLTVSEAVMRLDLGEHPAMMFRNSANGGLNVVYRRPDGNIGWIEPNQRAVTGARA